MSMLRKDVFARSAIPGRFFALWTFIEELERKAEEAVDERLADYAAANTRAKAEVIALRGCMVMGPIEWPRDQQVRSYGLHLLSEACGVPEEEV